MVDNTSNFGSILREARENKRLDRTNVARRLRIRPDILEAIEDADFNRMPPRGYARNMVNAYAHFLGLNATEITRMYLDECYSRQRSSSASRVQNHGFDMGVAQRNPQGELRRDSSGRRRFSDGYHRENSTPMQRMGLASAQQRSRSRRGGLGEAGGSFYVSSAARSPVALSRLPFIIAGVIILVLVIIVCILLFGPKQSSTPVEEQVLPVTGISEQGSSVASSLTEAATEPEPAKAPDHTEVGFEVVDGAEVYLEVYIDGVAQLAETITGPRKETYNITGEIEFNIVAHPGQVIITQDSNPVTFEDDNADGVSTLTIRFADVLAAWEQKNAPSISQQSSSSSSSLRARTSGSSSSATVSSST